MSHGNIQALLLVCLNAACEETVPYPNRGMVMLLVLLDRREFLTKECCRSGLCLLEKWVLREACA